MKVILNEDVKHLGEEGDVKDVANGYFRNYLFPRGLAVPYNDYTRAFFESRREEIEERKKQKRTDAASVKERLEALTLKIVMPAGANGKLYGAVTSQTIVDELAKEGFEIERKRVELAGLTIKAVGTYHASVKLYENTVASIPVVVEAQPESPRASAKPARKPRHHEQTEKTAHSEDASVQAEDNA